jgi:hypothetical protein
MVGLRMGLWGCLCVKFKNGWDFRFIGEEEFKTKVKEILNL